MVALYPSDTQTNLDTDSTIATSFVLSNSSQPTSFTRPPSTAFSTAHLDLLNELQIFNASEEFFTAVYWAVNLDLGQFSSQNIFTDPDLLSDATDIFHDNVFINFTFQETPLSDGRIPGDGYRSFKDVSVPLVQTPATIDTTYHCWQWIRKPALLALIDIIVPTIVLFVFICLTFYFVIGLLFARKRPSIFLVDCTNIPATGQDLLLVNTNRRESQAGHQRDSSYQSFEALNPEDQDLHEDQYFVPRPRSNIPEPLPLNVDP